MENECDHGPVPPQELEFNFRSGRLCLEFAATVGQRWQANIERLRSRADLSRWYRQSGLVNFEVPVSSAELETARVLREAIYRQAKRRIDGRQMSVHDVDLINAAGAYPSLVPVLQAGMISLEPPPRAALGRAALSTVARDAIDMFANVEADRLRECASDRCGLLFVDTSRPGRRRWCSSEACGGAARAVRYRQRMTDRTHPSTPLTHRTDK